MLNVHCNPSKVDIHLIINQETNLKQNLAKKQKNKILMKCFSRMLIIGKFAIINNNDKFIVFKRKCAPREVFCIFYGQRWRKMFFKNFIKWLYKFQLQKARHYLFRISIRTSHLTHFMPLVSFKYPGKRQKTITFVTFSMGIERGQYHKMGKGFPICNIFTSTYF